MSKTAASFSFSRPEPGAPEYRRERLFEMVPGVLSWSILIGMAVLSVRQPRVAAVLIIAFVLYWLFRLFYVTALLLISYARLACERDSDWLARAREVPRLTSYLKELEGRKEFLSIRERISHYFHTEDMTALCKSHSEPPPPLNEIYQLVLIPVVREMPEVIEPGLVSLMNQTFPAKQMVIVIALEDRAPAAHKRSIELMAKKYADAFGDFFVIKHPDGIPGEARVKGANVTYAAKEAARYFKERKIPFDRVVVSCFDADTVVPEHYFACLSYSFMVNPKRTRASYQPIPVYHNNIWNVPGFARVLDVGASFFQMVEVMQPEKLITFSSHSMSFKALVDIGYWPVDMISDDSAVFWKALFHFDGDYQVVPMYVTLSMDVAEGDRWWTTAVSVYKQKRRWAWGVENFPIVMRGFLRTGKIGFFSKLRYAFKLIEIHVAWATWPFLLTIIGWLPALFAGREFSNSVLYYSAPRITGIIFRLASLALVVSIVLSLSLLPKNPQRASLWSRVVHMFEWLLIPLIAIFFSAIPALEAQTRLMLGKRMEFWVTDKQGRDRPPRV